MKWLSKLFRKEQSETNHFKTESELYAYLGSLGVSAKAIVTLQDAKERIKAFEESQKT